MAAVLPDCMMPDGAEPCEGFQQLGKQVEQLHAKLHCMCGSPVDGHGMGDGHSPVSMYDYVLDQTQSENERLQARVAKLHEALSNSRCPYDSDDTIGECVKRNECACGMELVITAEASK
jgi:hypothetical protein